MKRIRDHLAVPWLIRPWLPTTTETEVLLVPPAAADPLVFYLDINLKDSGANAAFSCRRFEIRFNDRSAVNPNINK